MKSRVWVNLLMVVLLSGLLLTVSCAKKTVISGEPTIEDQTAEEKARIEREKQAALEEERTKQMMLEKGIAQAKEDFVNQDILFAYDSSELDAAAISLLRIKAAWLKANPMAKVTIEGHCDERGTTEYNLALGERRASAVKAYLVNLGISGSRLSMISYGEEQPIATGSTESAYRLNRRAHFAID